MVRCLTFIPNARGGQRASGPSQHPHTHPWRGKKNCNSSWHSSLLPPISGPCDRFGSRRRAASWPFHRRPRSRGDDAALKSAGPLWNLLRLGLGHLNVWFMKQDVGITRRKQARFNNEVVSGLCPAFLLTMKSCFLLGETWNAPTRSRRHLWTQHTGCRHPFDCCIWATSGTEPKNCEQQDCQLIFDLRLHLILY